MTGPELLLLFATGVTAGIVSTVVSLASVISYPTLLGLGLSPVTANVTNTFALCFTGLGAVAGSRPELSGQGERVRGLAVAVALGGMTGAAVLLLTPARGFEILAPLLIGGASLVMLFKPRLHPAAHEHTGRHSLGLLAAVFGVAIYVGYFGAASGVLLLAVLTTMLAEPLPRLNAIKNALAGVGNGVAALGFALFGPVEWSAVGPLAVGFLLGGWCGPKVVRRLPASFLRGLIGVAGLAVATWLGVSTYT